MNSFWHFVQNFWTCYGGYDICDEWQCSPGRFYANLTLKNRFFKVSFPYRLELYKIKRKYHLDIEIHFSNNQKENIGSRIKVGSKKEAIRKTLQIIKKFENNKEKIIEVWLKIRHQTPIINSKGVWVASLLLGNAGNLLYQNNSMTFGFGTFYVLGSSISWRDSTKFFHWTEYKTFGCGYSSHGLSSVPLNIWHSIFSLENILLDNILEQAKNIIKNSKLIMLQDKITGHIKAEKLLNDFYLKQLPK